MKAPVHLKDDLVRWLAIVPPLLLCACSVSPERHREARLMPPEVAKRVVDRHKGNGFSDRPVGCSHINNRDGCVACGGATNHQMQFQYSKVFYSTINRVCLNQTPYQLPAGCGSTVGFCVNVESSEDRDDLVDALISLGAKINVQ